MAREIVSNLKFKKTTGNFDPSSFSKMLNEAYLSTKKNQIKKQQKLVLVQAL